MLKKWIKKINGLKKNGCETAEDTKKTAISKNLEKNIEALRTLTGNSNDIVIRQFSAGGRAAAAAGRRSPGRLPASVESTCCPARRLAALPAGAFGAVSPRLPCGKGDVCERRRWRMKRGDVGEKQGA